MVQINVCTNTDPPVDNNINTASSMDVIRIHCLVLLHQLCICSLSTVSHTQRRPTTYKSAVQHTKVLYNTQRCCMYNTQRCPIRHKSAVQHTNELYVQHTKAPHKTQRRPTTHKSAVQHTNMLHNTQRRPTTYKGARQHMLYNTQMCHT